MENYSLKDEIDEFYKESKKYEICKQFKDYIDPLKEAINTTENTTELEQIIINLNKVITYYKEHNIFLPLPHDHRYENIKKYNDFEFTNCIAYEMVIRREEFYEAELVVMTIEDFEKQKAYYLEKENVELCYGYIASNEDFVKKLKTEIPNMNKNIQTLINNNITEKDLQHNNRPSEIIYNIICVLQKRLKELKLELKKLGIPDFRHYSFTGRDFFDFCNRNFTSLSQIQRTLYINDFKNGLSLLIDFYLPKERIYKKNIMKLNLSQ